MDALIEYIAKALVDRPEEVHVRASDTEEGKLYELQVHPKDVGKVIGRDGRTVNAMRTLLVAAAQQKGLRAGLKILDDRRGAQNGQAPAPQPPAEGAAEGE